MLHILATALLLTVASAQLITPAPEIPLSAAAALQRRQSDPPSSSYSRSKFCLLDDPGCLSSSSLYDACSAQWGTAYISQWWCECTTSIIVPALSCQACENATLTGTNTLIYNSVNAISSRCASLSYSFNKTTVRPSGYFDPQEFVKTSKASFEGEKSLTRTTVSVPTDNLLSGLVASATPSEGVNGAAPTNGGGRRYDGGSQVVVLGFGIVLSIWMVSGR